VQRLYLVPPNHQGDLVRADYHDDPEIYLPESKVKQGGGSKIDIVGGIVTFSKTSSPSNVSSKF
jgi:hypothetical protein